MHLFQIKYIIKTALSIATCCLSPRMSVADIPSFFSVTDKPVSTQIFFSKMFRYHTEIYT